MRSGFLASSCAFEMSLSRGGGAPRWLPWLLTIIVSFSPSYGQSPAGRSSEGASRRYRQALTEAQSRWRQGSFQEAFSLLESAREHARSLKDARKEVASLLLMGRLCWAIDRPKDSQDFYAEALAGARNLGLEKEAAESQRALDIWELYAQGQAHLLAGQADGSIAEFNSAAELARKIGSREHEIKCLRQLSLGYWARQEPAMYLSLNERSLEIAKDIKDRKEQARSLINIGSHYLSSSDYSRALNYYSEALDISRQAGNRQAESLCQKNISVILNHLGFYERSLDCSLAAYEIDQKLGNRVLLSHDMNNLGEGFRNQGLLYSRQTDLYEALDRFMAALDSAKRNGDRKTEMRALNNIGSIHLQFKKYHSAQNYFRSTYQIAEEVRDGEAMTGVLNNLGICRFKVGNYERAKRFLEEALESGRPLGTNPTLWESSFYLGQCLEKEGAYPQAAECYKNSIAAIDYIRSQIVFDDYKVGFAKNKFKVFESLIDLLSRLDKAEGSSSRSGEIFGIVERAKARAFLETLGEAGDGPGGKPDPLLARKEGEISNQISAIIQELSRTKASPSRIAELERTLQGHEEEYLRLVSRMRLDGTAAGVISPVPIQVERVQEGLLDERTAILEYFLGEKNSLLFLITKKKFAVVSLPPKREIEKSLGAYLELLSNPPRREWQGRLAAERLSRALLASVPENLPESIERLVFIPDGLLLYLPFETLPLVSGKPPAADFLVSRYAVSYAPSCSSLLFLKDRKSKERYVKGLLAVGDPVYPSGADRKNRITVANIMREIYEAQGHDFSPLAQSGREVRKIARFFSESNRTLYLKRQASEEIIKTSPLAGYQIIHFACHGFFDERLPRRSALVLSFDENSGGEGFLQVHEIASLRLAAELVVLSACETGRGTIEKGEGILGLTRAFFHAGARSVVSTLWEVGDKATAEFMGRFYYYLSQKEDKARALRSAKLSLLQTKYAAPFYWAAFVLNGDDSSTLDVH